MSAAPPHPEDELYELDTRRMATSTATSATATKKKGRGRPRKILELKPPPVDEPTDEELMAMMEAEGGGGGAPVDGEEPPIEASEAMHLLINGQIIDMQELIGIKGGFNPRQPGITFEQKKAELEQLYSQADAKRGNDSIFLFFEAAVGFIQMGADYAKQEGVEWPDLSTKYKFADEVKNAKGIFKDALKQLSIKYRWYFACGPEREIVQNFIQVGRVCDMKNQQYKKMARLTSEPSTPENDPTNSPTSQ